MNSGKRDIFRLVEMLLLLFFNLDKIEEVKKHAIENKVICYNVLNPRK